MKKWQKLSEEILHKNPWYEYKYDKYVLPNGKEGDYYYVHVPGMGIVIPLLDNGRIALVKQYRYLFNRDSIEFPGGARKEEQSFEENAREELKEETGYEAGNLSLIGKYAPYNGITDEMTHLFLATDLKRGENHPEETEEIEILTKTPEEIDEMIEKGEIWDGQTIAAWTLARKYLVD